MGRINGYFIVSVGSSSASAKAGSSGTRRGGSDVVDVDRERRDLENVVLEAHQGLVGPDAQPAVLGEAVRRRSPGRGKSCWNGGK